jgi:large subunit GTPase 1
MDGEPETTRDSSDEEESDDDEGAEGLRESRAEASETSSEEEEDDEQGDGIHLGDIEEDENDPRTRVLSVLQLEDLFVKSAPDLSRSSRALSHVFLH